MRSQLHLQTIYKDLRIDRDPQQTNLWILQFVLTVAMDGQPHIDKTVPPVGKIAKTVVLPTTSRKFAENLNINISQKPRVNNVDDSISEAATVGTSATVGEQDNHIDRLLQKQSIYDANYDSDCDDYDDNFVAIISINNDTREVEPVNLDICIGNTSKKTLVDLECVCTIINKSTATTIV